MEQFIFFEESWNENTKINRRREVHDRGTFPTCQTPDDTKTSRTE